MGKVILEFDSVEERDDIKSALDGYKWKLAMWDLDQKLRSTAKYGVSILGNNQETSTMEYDITEKYRELIREILDEYSLNIND
jgi:hypothetical protein